MNKEELRAEATKWFKKNPHGLAMRTCWKCNAAHEYFKKDTSAWLMTCFECGHWFWRGKDITKVTKRSSP